MASDFWSFVSSIWSHWQSLTTGGVLALGILVYEHLKRKPISWRTMTAIMGLGLFCSCFLAWRDEHKSAETLNAEKRDLIAQNSGLKATIDTKDKELQRWRDERLRAPTQVQVQVPPSRIQIVRVPETVPVERSPRHLTEDTQRTLVATLSAKTGPTLKVSITCVMGDVEGNKYAHELLKVLKSAGWPAEGVNQAVFTGPVEGLHIVVQSQNVPAAARLQHALVSVGIEAPGELRTGMPPDQIDVIVGARKD
jgi:hypothetical protein